MYLYMFKYINIGISLFGTCIKNIDNLFDRNREMFYIKGNEDIKLT